MSETTALEIAITKWYRIKNAGNAVLSQRYIKVVSWVKYASQNAIWRNTLFKKIEWIVLVFSKQSTTI